MNLAGVKMEQNIPTDPGPSGGRSQEKTTNAQNGKEVEGDERISVDPNPPNSSTGSQESTTNAQNGKEVEGEERISVDPCPPVSGTGCQEIATNIQNEDEQNVQHQESHNKGFIYTHKKPYRFQVMECLDACLHLSYICETFSE